MVNLTPQMLTDAKKLQFEI